MGLREDSEDRRLTLFKLLVQVGPDFLIPVFGFLHASPAHIRPVGDVAKTSKKVAKLQSAAVINEICGPFHALLSRMALNARGVVMRGFKRVRDRLINVQDLFRGG